MARLIRAQTAHGDTIIEFLDDVMQDRTDGFKTHHRIAAAKELIVHILRDEQPAPTPSPSTGEGWGEGDTPVVPAHTTVVPAEAGTQGGSGARSAAANPAHPEPNSPVVPAQSLPQYSIRGGGTQGGGGARSTAANPARTEPVLSTAEGSAHPESHQIVVPAPPAVVPAEAGTHPRDPEPGSQLETKNSKLETLPTRRTRTQRRREGAARAAAHGKRHEPDPWAAPIDSTNPGRSPPR